MTTGEGVLNVGSETTGANRSEIQQQALDRVWFHATPTAALENPHSMSVFVRGEGCYLFDSEGRRFLDGLSGGAWVVATGHGRAEIAEAMSEQAKQLAYVVPYSYTTPVTVELSRILAEITPGDLDHPFFVNSGSEAVEAAFKMCRQYHHLSGQPMRYKVIGRQGSYHGSTYWTMSASGASHAFNNSLFEPVAPGFLHVPSPHCYRCAYGMTYPACDLYCARAIEDLIVFEGPDTVSAVIAEPVSASATTVIPPAEYLPMLRDICSRHGVLLILDEVINGFGRTGKMFAAEHWDVVADIMTVAKGLSAGYAPIAAAIASNKVHEKFLGAPRNTALCHVSTFGGHPVASAAAKANIEIILREKLVDNAREVGVYLLEGLRSLESHPTVGNVRGIGMLCAVELVLDRQTRQQFAPEHMMSPRMNKYLWEEGIICRAWDVIQIAPPLVATRAVIDELVGKLDRAIGRFERDLGL